MLCVYPSIYSWMTNKARSVTPHPDSTGNDDIVVVSRVLTLVLFLGVLPVYLKIVSTLETNPISSLPAVPRRVKGLPRFRELCFGWPSSSPPPSLPLSSLVTKKKSHPLLFWGPGSWVGSATFGERAIKCLACSHSTARELVQAQAPGAFLSNCGCIPLVQVIIQSNHTVM